MLAGVTLVALVLLVLTVATLRERLGLTDSLREVLLVAGALWGGFVVACAELLSLGSWFRFGPVLACWLGLDLLLLVTVVLRRRRLPGWWRGALPTPRPVDWLLLTLCALVLAGTGLCAVLGPPNNCDSLVYHLPRQVRWIQQGSVAHFPTGLDRQLCFPPFAEFAGAQLMILAGDDRWANLVQWSALVLTMVAVSLLARDVGLGGTGQVLAALFVVTVPMAYLQAFNTKNDLVVSFWLCSASWWALRVWAGRPLAGAPAVLFGLTLGLLTLTKSTGYLFAVPVAAVAGSGILLRQRARWRPAAVILTTALLINVGHCTRNLQVFHSPFGPPEAQKLHNNETFAPAAIASNVIRNLALHLGAPGQAWNVWLTERIEGWHRRLGIDVHDPRTTFVPQVCQFRVFYAPENEDLAPAPAHVVLALLFSALVPFWLVWGRPGTPARLYLVIPYGCFFVFCLVLKWQPWHPRLQLPVFCLFGVVLAAFCTGRYGRWVGGVAVAGCLSALAASMYLCYTKTLFTERSLLRHKREDIFFAACPQWQVPTRRSAAWIARRAPRTIGLCGFHSQYEYFVERLVLDNMKKAPPAFLPFPRGERIWGDMAACRSLSPDLVVSFNAYPRLLRHMYTGEVYVAVEQDGPYTLYLPATSVADPEAASDRCPFVGWSGASGWKDFGYLPAVRPVLEALPPAWQLVVEGEGRPLRLSAECRGTGPPGQVLIVRVNGEERYRHPFSARVPWEQFDVVLPMAAGTNVVEMESQPPCRSPKDRPAAVFRRLQFLPVAADESGSS
jgi:hypothetical protein